LKDWWKYFLLGSWALASMLSPMPPPPPPTIWFCCYSLVLAGCFMWVGYSDSQSPTKSIVFGSQIILQLYSMQEVLDPSSSWLRSFQCLGWTSTCIGTTEGWRTRAPTSR
jgi:hypothetical protein